MRNRILRGGLFPPESGRYILYITWMCPYAGRCAIMRELKGLQNIVKLAVVHPVLTEDRGWRLDQEFPGVTGDPLGFAKNTKDIYMKSDPAYGGKYPVPILFDSKSYKIVNNDSPDIMRIFNTDFNELLDDKYRKIDMYPEALRSMIDSNNAFIQDMVNDAPYRAGFATAQDVYDKNVEIVFQGLDRVEELLSDGRSFINGSEMTETDVRLFTSIVRFDPAYCGALKCNNRMIRFDYPNIHNWLRRLYWGNEVFKHNTFFDHIKEGYYKTIRIKSNCIVPAGPIPNIMKL